LIRGDRGTSYAWLSGHPDQLRGKASARDNLRLFALADSNEQAIGDIEAGLLQSGDKITIAGVKGGVRKAFLYWHGIDISGSGAVYDNETITFAGSQVKVWTRLSDDEHVYGFGEQKTPESFRQACRKFIYTENLLPEAQTSTAEEGISAKALQPPSAAIPILNKAMMQMETEDGWVGLGTVGQRLANIASDFDPRTYGFRKLSDLVRQTGAFEMDQPEGRAVRIRAKPAHPSRSRPAQAAAPRRALK
jgi:hypothetical protein